MGAIGDEFSIASDANDPAEREQGGRKETELGNRRGLTCCSIAMAVVFSMDVLTLFR